MLAQNALLFSKPVVALAQHGIPEGIHVIIICIAFVNFFNLAVNWIESRRVSSVEKNYTQLHLFWDVVILAIFFILTQSLLDSLGATFEVSQSSIMITIGIFYIFLNVAFILWNNVEIATTKPVEVNMSRGSLPQILRAANVRNAISITLAVVLILSASIASNSWVASLSESRKLKQT